MTSGSNGEDLLILKEFRNRIDFDLEEKSTAIMDLDLDCHLNWVDVRSVPPDFVFTLGERNNIWLETTELNDLSLLSTRMSQWFSMATHAHWEEDYEAAVEHLDTASDVLESQDQQDVSRFHRSAFRYLIRANRAVLEFRKFGNCLQVEESKKWACEVDVTERKTKAMILAMKAGVVGFFGQREERVRLYKEVVVLDPDYPEYWKELFMALRRLRREDDHVSRPTSEEWSCMKKAMEVDGDNDSPSILNGMTTLLHDCIKDTNTLEFKSDPDNRITLEEHVLEMKSYARKAYDANPECSNSGIRLAEILCVSSKGEKWSADSGDMREAEAQFELCLEKWPRSSHVLHKAGKFYFIVRHDHVRGLELIAESLVDEETNFPSLMDLLRYTYQRNKKCLLNDNEHGTTGLIDLIDVYLPLHEQRKALSSKLLSLKATVLAKQHEFEQALEIWLQAIEIYPNIWTPAAENVKARKSQIFGQSTLRQFLHPNDFKKLAEFVANEIAEEPMDSDRLKLLKKIQGAIQEELGSYNNTNRDGPRRKPVSDSEVDPNWRSRSSSDSTDQSDDGPSSNGDSSDYINRNSSRSNIRTFNGDLSDYMNRKNSRSNTRTFNGDSSDYMNRNGSKFNEYPPPGGRRYYGSSEERVSKISDRSAPSYSSSWGNSHYSNGNGGTYNVERGQGASGNLWGQWKGQEAQNNSRSRQSRPSYQSQPPKYRESDADDNWRRK